MNLIEARLNRGLSRAQAANGMAIARATLVAAEEGRAIQPSSAKRIADFYGVQVTDIWPLKPNGDEVAA